MDRFNEMETFVRVVETGSFSEAARDLRMTPSAVSKLIGRLEDRLGVRLLSRTTRKLSLTEEGRVYFQRVSPILAEVEEAEQTVSMATLEPRGVLRVNSSTAFGQYQIQPLIPAMLEKYPYLQVQMTLSDSISNLVEEGVNGFLVPTGDYDGLTQRLMSLMNDRSLRERFGQMSRKLYEERFTGERFILGVEAAILKAIESPKPIKGGD